ncbi:hypothetical protein SAMN05421504_105436 [Amycolatopsis xylanica]|uniref:Uncharacterized protein n=1 Tax=Amycolatopsis xylanica TaxID=589385 RepID=A0A1H3JJ22_9PSEU|nr:hypothetical protein [Amycolatopsis xylanica]SDY40000.1 hypothetical protein SAMN05421504_105436 [Amycolatopsis xylanica]
MNKQTATPPVLLALARELLGATLDQQRLLRAVPGGLDAAMLAEVERTYRDTAAEIPQYRRLVDQWNRQDPAAEGLADLSEVVDRLSIEYSEVFDLITAQRVDS